VQETLDHIRRSAAGAETISYIYVVDEQGRLIDDIHLSRLVMADPQARLKDLVEENVVVLHALEDREEAVATFKKYDRIALAGRRPVRGAARDRDGRRRVRRRGRRGDRGHAAVRRARRAWRTATWRRRSSC
jgi:hypothetical protein